MGKIKILHTADLHLNAPVYGLPPGLAAIRKEEQRMALANIVDMAISGGTDALLIAGDLFNSANIPVQTALFVKKCFERISNIPIFIAPGNHDYVTDISLYNNFDFGSHVYIFKDKLEFYELNDKKTRIWGCGFNSQTVKESYIKDFVCPDDDYINILVMHAEISSEGMYNPSTVEMLGDTKFDYIALGHVHGYNGISFKGNTAYAYSGMPEGLYFDEPGEKGVIIGEVDKGHTSLKFAVTSKRENVTLNVDISGCETYDDVTKIINAEVKDSNNLYKIILTGDTGKDIYFDKNIIELKLKDSAFFIKIINETKTVNDRKKGASVLTKAFEDILSQKQLDEATFKRAMKFGLDALEGREVKSI